jgi:hypothetical protein
MVEHRECVGEVNCFERAAPSYLSKRTTRILNNEGEIRQSHLAAFSRSIDLNRIDLGLPLAAALPEASDIQADIALILKFCVVKQCTPKEPSRLIHRLT